MQPETPSRGRGAFATRTVLPFTGLTGPYGVAVDTGGNVYITASQNKPEQLCAQAGRRRVLQLADGGTTPIELPFTGLNHPVGVAVDSGGNLYVTDSQDNRVLKLPAVSN